MEDFLKWRDNWLTGIEEVDVQHAELTAHLNRIARTCFRDGEQDAADSPGETDQSENMATRLYDMTKHHFQYEEQLMLEAGYPDYPAHAYEHNMLLAELKLMIRTCFKEGGKKIDCETLKALKSWFVVHVTHNDKLFAQFMSRQRTASTDSGSPQ